MKKIFIVEDIELNIDLLVQLLEDDYELITAEDGASGVQLAEQEKPDLIGFLLIHGLLSKLYLEGR